MTQQHSIDRNFHDATAQLRTAVRASFLALPIAIGLIIGVSGVSAAEIAEACDVTYPVLIGSGYEQPSSASEQTRTSLFAALLGSGYEQVEVPTGCAAPEPRMAQRPAPDTARTYDVLAGSLYDLHPASETASAP